MRRCSDSRKEMRSGQPTNPYGPAALTAGDGLSSERRIGRLLQNHVIVDSEVTLSGGDVGMPGSACTLRRWVNFNMVLR